VATQPRKVTKEEKAGTALAFISFVALPAMVSFAIYMTVRKR